MLIATVALVLLAIAGGAAVRLYTELLWYGALGYGDALWTRLGTTIGVRFVMGAIGAVIVLANLWTVTRQLGPVHLRRRYGNLEISEQVPRAYVGIGIFTAAVLAGWWLSGIEFTPNASLGVLAALRAEDWGVVDPLFGRDLAFYVFALPVLQRFVSFLLLILLWSLLLTLLGYVLLGAVRARDNRIEVDEPARTHFAFVCAALVTFLGVRYLLARYGVLFDGSGVAGGVGYTDVHARLPAQTILAVLSFAAAGAIVYGALRRNWFPPVAALGTWLAAALLAGVVYPAAVQKLRVEPNELAREAPYIEWLMEFTRQGFGLHDIERRSYDPREGNVGSAISGARDWLDQVPLWDQDPLRTALQQEQSFRAYYRFHDVDFDRYVVDGELRQTGIAVREFYAQGLAAENRTWRNTHLNPSFTRGWGAVVVPVAEAARGEPVYWLAQVNPVERDAAAPPELELTEPSVFFGEAMSEYVVLTPQLTDSIGRATPVDAVTTGIPLSSAFRLLAFAWRFSDQNLLFANEIEADSRIVYRRRVIERVSALAPFLLWDDDAHPVVIDGRIVWLLDGYSVTGSFPLSEPTAEEVAGIRYMRSSVKAVVDGVSGAVTFYAIDDDEPILRTYRSIFPAMFQPFAAMPSGLREHLRFPPALMRIQADKLGRFHIDRAETFYAGQDAWARPPEAAVQGGARPFRPNFVISQLPGSDRPEFVLVVPFIAAERQNMTSLLIARNDNENYGRLLLLEMPRDRQVKGPGQVHALIEQDANISAQLTLWRSGGSEAQPGEMRVLPLDSAIVYVEPLYLSASGNPFPQLQQVIVTDGAAVSMAPGLLAALAALDAEHGGSVVAAVNDLASSPVNAQLAASALRILEQADRALRAGAWAEFGARWQELQTLLRQASTAPSSQP